jgi:hypothetical protein
MVPPASTGVPPAPAYSGYPIHDLSDHDGTLTLSGRPSQTVCVRRITFIRSYNPGMAVTTPVWAVPHSLATTKGITIVFSSCGYLDVSVHRVCLLSDSQAAPDWVAPFGYRRIGPCQRVPVAFRCLPRPSSLLKAKVSPGCSCFVYILPLPVQAGLLPLMNQRTRFGSVGQRTS